jgi:hypothetical protein
MSDEQSIETRLAVLEERVKSQKALMDLEFKGRDDALKLQYEITEKHLKDLNGHNEETRKNLEITVSKEKFDGLVNGSIAQLTKFMERAEMASIDRDRKIGEIMGDTKANNAFRENVSGRIAMITLAGSILGGGGMAALISFLKTQ